MSVAWRLDGGLTSFTVKGCGAPLCRGLLGSGAHTRPGIIAFPPGLFSKSPSSKHLICSGLIKKQLSPSARLGAGYMGMVPCVEYPGLERVKAEPLWTPGQCR